MKQVLFMLLFDSSQFSFPLDSFEANMLKTISID